VLFLCTHNSARSILAEALATHLSGGRLQGYSAGSQPSGVVNPQALATLRELGCRTDELHSKSWDEFAAPDAIPMDLIITVCDNAANEVCPVWPRAPVTAHWACRDPSAITGDEQATAIAFQRTAALLSQRILCLRELPINELDPASLSDALARIARDTRPFFIECVR
jgi:arsenate reductase